MNHSTISFLDRVNLFRIIENLNSINGYYCKTCGEKNSHTTHECTKNRCKICRDNHLTRYCEYWINVNGAMVIILIRSSTNIKIKQIVGILASYVVILVI